MASQCVSSGQNDLDQGVEGEPEPRSVDSGVQSLFGSIANFRCNSSNLVDGGAAATISTSPAVPAASNSVNYSGSPLNFRNVAEALVAHRDRPFQMP